jgi:spore germination cell wall hydrolase CwlJ-like protein
MGAVAGAVVGLALGGAYLAGGMARDAVTHATVSRIADQAVEGYSEDSLRQMAQGDNGALAVALRYDPDLLASYASHVRQDTVIAEKLQDAAPRLRPSGLFLRASVNVPFAGAAQPYHAGAFDQSKQLDCLSQAVYYEARGETPSGQAAVAQVVLNRVRHPAFPKSVCAVVFQGAQTGHGCQFSFACDGSTLRGREPGAWRRAQKIATRAMDGYVMTDVGNSTHFHVSNLSPNWGGLMKVAQIGTHIFYRFGGGRGLGGAFVGKPTDEVVAAERSPLIAAMVTTPVEVAPAPQTVKVDVVAKPEGKPEPVAQVSMTAPSA